MTALRGGIQARWCHKVPRAFWAFLVMGFAELTPVDSPGRSRKRGKHPIVRAM